MNQRLWHLPIERYRQRYTEWLDKAEKRAFKSKFNLSTIRPRKEDASAVIDIRAGQVLDQFNRPLWSLAQISRLIEESSSSPGKAYFSDFYTPGLDAVAYSGLKLDVCSFMWAQTFDRFDFTQKHINWMRPFEVMAFEIYKKVFVAHEMLADLTISAIPQAESKIEVVGLPFNSKLVRGLLDPDEIPSDEYDVAYTSRWDTEKNPGMFLDLVESRTDLSFVVCTGHPDLLGSDSQAITRAKRVVSKGKNLTVFSDCTKGRYYAVLSKCRVQFNASLQDWVSFTLLEALTFGCSPLYPNTRSFPDTLQFYEPSLYIPFTVESAQDKLETLLTTPFPKSLASDILNYHDGTLGRITKHIEAL